MNATCSLSYYSHGMNSSPVSIGGGNVTLSSSDGLIYVTLRKKLRKHM